MSTSSERRKQKSSRHRSENRPEGFEPSAFSNRREGGYTLYLGTKAGRRDKPTPKPIPTRGRRGSLVASVFGIFGGLMNRRSGSRGAE